jgi:hypothetical protein
LPRFGRPLRRSTARTRFFIPLLLLVLFATACGPTRAGSGGPEAVDPLRLAQILPTPAGLADAGPARRAVVEQVQTALADQEDPEGAEGLRNVGFRDGAIREWTTDEGGRMTLVTSAWDERITATSVGAGSVRLLADEPGARAWTPSGVPGSQGVRVGGEIPRQALAVSVGENLIFIRAEGPVPERAIVRTMELAVRAAEGGLDDGTVPVS